MRNPKNYFKFMENVALGKLSSKVVCKDNGVLECMSYVTIEELETRAKCKITFEENEIVIMQRLINEEVVDICNIRDGRIFYIATFLLDNYKTQKELKLAIYRAVVEFLLSNRQEIDDCQEDEEIVGDIDNILWWRGESQETKTATRNTIETIPHVDVDYSNLKKVPKNCLYGMFGGYPSISEMYNDKCFCCLADRKGNECKGKKTCGKTWKRYEAIINPEWHHVSLNTLANLDFDMLDEKRQLYLKLYRELKELIQDLHKCKSVSAYERRLDKMYIRNNELVVENKISRDYINYFTRKISMCNVECGLWTSRVEEATGLHKSRRYNRYILKY